MRSQQSNISEGNTFHTTSSGKHSFIEKLEGVVEKNLKNEQFGVIELANSMGISRFQLHRKLQKLTGQSVSQFIREFRLKKALELLKRKEETASEISYQVGFGSPTYFNKCFKEHYGFTPGEVKNLKLPEPKWNSLKNNASIKYKWPEKETFLAYFEEINRRKVLITGIVYILVGWLMFQLLNLSGYFVLIHPSIAFIFYVVILMGFPVSLYLSWKYEKSETGFIKITSDFDENYSSSIRNTKPLTGTVSFSVILVLILSTYMVPNFIPNFPEQTKYQYTIHDKSIAVLPFKVIGNDSNDQYFADGIMEAIKNHLSGLKDLKVASRTSVEYYTDTEKTIDEIGEELEVEYILEGSVQRHSDRVRVTASIFNVSTNKTVLTHQYTESMENIFALMTKIAMDVTDELNITLSSHEKTMITNIPTSDVDAYDLYLQAKMFHTRYRTLFNAEDIEASDRLYRQALEIDSLFALAYVGLGEVCREKLELFGVRSMYEKEYADSILMYASRAIDLDPYLANAYALRGHYYEFVNEIENAIKDQEKAISLNPNLTVSYLNLAKIWRDLKGDPVKAFIYFKKALNNEKKGALLPDILFEISWIYMGVNDFENAEKYIRLSSKFRPGLNANYGPLMWMNIVQGKFQTAFGYADSICANQPENIDCLGWYGMLNAYVGEYDKALEMFDRSARFTQSDKEVGSVVIEREHVGNIHEGYIYLRQGNHEKGMEILNELLNNVQGIPWSKAWNESEIYAAMGAYDKALVKLKEMAQINQYQTMTSFLPHYYLFQGMFDNPEFKKLLRHVNENKEKVQVKIHEIEREGISMD